MLLNAQNISYQLPSGRELFTDINFSLNRSEKAAITGNNGTGKSTLLQILAGRLTPRSGIVTANAPLYYVPQHFGQLNHLTVAQALGADTQLQALEAILQGDTQEHHFDALGDNWDIAARCEEALHKWGLSHISLQAPFTQLSGGEKTRLLLAGTELYRPGAVLLDEPTNHLDKAARAQLYEWMQQTSCTLLTVSHDRQLLQICNPIWELFPTGMKAYGGNYDFYESQKTEEQAALQRKIAHAEKTVKEARQQQRESMERQQRENARGERQRKEGNIPKILLNGRRNLAERTTARLQEVHTDKVAGLQDELEKATAAEHISRIMKGHFETPPGHHGKTLIKAEGINFAWPGGTPMWKEPLQVLISSGDRLAIAGSNGSGKSTLIQLMLGKLMPQTGELYRANCRTLLLDQDYTLIDRNRTVLEQAEAFNETGLEPHQVKTALARFLFEKDSWDKPCSVLSGGEMLRLSLCTMTLACQSPDMIILDEPTNNLDLSNIKMLSQIFSAYKGTLIVISHDTTFTAEVGVTATLEL
ncbi:ABC-F family ATP-binding cassette domain-containing protein [Chitinophaga solisilvae]|uniref:ABC-F family ATP-binding cassette domain-containing protein n=1 Tax=Chitinophaga solisilvae TaxID=1233460 RepID=UPI0013703E49|nr:ABC-F family ATP-binding cassette domain-containing protein [Chitinophaga solisilvae]